VKNQGGIDTIACMEKENSLFDMLEFAKNEGKEEIKMHSLRFTVDHGTLKSKLLGNTPSEVNNTKNPEPQNNT
jgi:hypothetical protein